MSLLHINKKVKILAILTAFLIGFLPLNADECQKRLFSIQVSNTVTINEILNQLSDQCKFSTVAKDNIASEELQKSINSINIKNMSLREVFNVLLTENNLNYEYKNGILKISSLFTKTFKIDYITSIRQGTAITKASVDAGSKKVGEDSSNEADSDNSISSSESFDFWKTIKEEITLVLNNGTEKYTAIAPIVNPNAGLVTVTATRSQINRVQSYINNLQKRLKKQVMLDVSIIKVDLKNNYKTGIDWTKFQIGFGNYVGGDKYGDSSLGYSVVENPVNSLSRAVENGFFTVAAGFNFNINGMINFLEEKGNAKVISNPKVIALHNQPALISVGTNYSYLLKKEEKSGTGENKESTVNSEEFKTFVGILLNILPEISEDNKIMLRINPSLSELANPEQLKSELNKSPYTRENKLSTVAYVNDGDTVILGGLISQAKDKNNNRIPILSSIPLVGGLFKSTNDIVSTTELVFVITPHIVKNTGRPISESLKELGYSKSIYEY